MSLTDHLGPGDGLLTSEGRGSEPLPALWWADPADAAESRLLYPDALSLGDPHPLLPSSRRVLAAGGRDLTRGAPLYLAEDAAAVPSASLLLVTSERARVALEDATDASPCLVVGLDASDDVARLWRTSGPGLVLAFIDAVPARTRLLVQAFARAFPMRRDVELLVFAQDEAGCTAALADEAAIRVLPLERLQGVDGDDRFDLLVADDDSRRAMPLAEAVGRQKRLLRVSLDPADDGASIVDHVAFELREAARVFLKLGVGHDAAAAIAEDDRPSWRAKGGLLKQLVSGVVPGASTLDGIGWITRWNVPCGIGDHAAHQIAEAGGRNVVLAPREGGLVRPDENWVYRCWTEGVLENGLADVMDVVYSQRLATIIIHCNWSFYHPGALRRLVGELRAAGRVVFIDMHSTSSGQNFGWRVSDFVDALRMADRVMVHQPADFDRIKSAVPEAKVVVEPLGISMTHARDSATSEPELIGCFGFCFPNKGIEQLVMAASLLREKRPELRLLLLNAEHPLEISRQTVASIRALIDDLGLGDAVTFVTDFLDEQECMRRLARTSLIVNPYRRTTESASAAVRYALASESPVLVTPLRIFDDLGDAVFRARGTEPEALSEAMDRVLDELADRTRHARQVEEAADRWRQDHDLAVQTRRIVKRAEIIAQNNRRLEWSRFCTLG